MKIVLVVPVLATYEIEVGDFVELKPGPDTLREREHLARFVCGLGHEVDRWLEMPLMRYVGAETNDALQAAYPPRMWHEEIDNQEEKP